MICKFTPTSKGSSWFVILASRVPGEGQPSRLAYGIKFCGILDLDISLPSFPATAFHGHAITLALSQNLWVLMPSALYPWFPFLEGSSPLQGSFLALEIPAQVSEVAVSVKSSIISTTAPKLSKVLGTYLSVLQYPMYIRL